jgi:hypothetical protein
MGEKGVKRWRVLDKQNNVGKLIDLGPQNGLA